MTMFNDIDWDAKGNEELCENISKTCWSIRWTISSRSLVFLGAWISEKVVRNLRWHTKWILDPNGGENAAELREIWSSDIPLYQCPGKRKIKKQRGKKHNKKFTACYENVRLLPKMVMSVNQVSLYGAVADLIQELPVDQRAPGRPFALGQTEQEILTQLPIAEVPSNDERQGIPEVFQIVLRSRFEFGRSWTVLLCSSVTQRSKESIFLQRIHVTSRGKGNLCKRVDRKRCTIRPCLVHKKFAKHTG